MNANNVEPYGKLAHEVAQQGGVAAYKAAQKALLNTVKEKSFNDGVSAGKKELVPWLIVTGLVAISSSAYGGYKFFKNKHNKKKMSEKQLAKEAEEAEQILTEIPLHEDIISEIKEETEDEKHE